MTIEAEIQGSRALPIEEDRRRKAVVSFATRPSSLGVVLVARSASGNGGICAVLLGDDAGALRSELHARFPRASLIAGDEELEAIATRVAAFVESPARSIDVPLDMRGTDFQRTVWRALREIPAGSTASYTEIARRIGRPTAVRAVAHACAANPLAVVVPCHRAVRSDGALAGYRWGLERKRSLLDKERAS